MTSQAEFLIEIRDKLYNVVLQIDALSRQETEEHLLAIWQQLVDRVENLR
jgi:hypothetical protein